MCDANFNTWHDPRINWIFHFLVSQKLGPTYRTSYAPVYHHEESIFPLLW